MLLLKPLLTIFFFVIYVQAADLTPLESKYPFSSVVTIADDIQGEALSFDDATKFSYVTSWESHNVLEVSKDGSWTVLAGCSRAGFEDNVARLSACFDSPSGIRKMPNEQIWFVADYGNARIRVITAEGVTTLAGNGNKEHLDGIGTGASFVAPYAVALDVVNRALYVADGFFITRVVLREGPLYGSCTTYGNVQDKNLQDYYGSDGKGVVGGLTFDPRRNFLYMAVTTENVVKRMNLNPDNYAVEVFAGTGSNEDSADGPRTSVSIRRPWGVASDSYTNQIYISGYEGRRIVKITCQPFDDACAIDNEYQWGWMRTIAGGSDSSGFADNTAGLAGSAVFASPMAISFSRQLGIAVVSDYGNRKIRKVVVQGYISGLKTSTERRPGEPVTIESGQTVSISGDNLGLGDDIWEILIQGNSGTILSQTATQLTVKAIGVNSQYGGDIYIFSRGTGTTYAHYGQGSYKATPSPSPTPYVAPTARTAGPTQTPTPSASMTATPTPTASMTATPTPTALTWDYIIYIGLQTFRGADGKFTFTSSNVSQGVTLSVTSKTGSNASVTAGTGAYITTSTGQSAELAGYGIVNFFWPERNIDLASSLADSRVISNIQWVQTSPLPSPTVEISPTPATNVSSLRLCNLLEGAYTFEQIVEDIEGSYTVAEFKVVINPFREHWVGVICAILTIWILLCLLCALISTCLGVKAGHVIIVLWFAQFCAALGGLNLLFPDSWVTYYDGMSWSFLHFPLLWESTRSGDMPGHIFTQLQPYPTYDNICPRDWLYLWFRENAGYSFFLLFLAVIIAIILLLFLVCCYGFDSLPGRLSFWKVIYFTVAALAFGVVAHSARVFLYVTTAGALQVVIAVIWVIIIILYILFVLSGLRRKIATQKAVAFRKYSEGFAPTERTEIVCCGLFKRIGEWEDVNKGARFMKNHGWLFRKFRFARGAYEYHILELFLLLIDGLILGLFYLYSPFISIALLIAVEFFHFLYLVFVQPFVESMFNYLAMGTRAVAILLLVLCIGIAVGKSPDNIYYIGNAMVFLAALWQTILILACFRTMWFSTVYVFAKPPPIELDLGLRKNTRSVWDEFPTYLSDNTTRNVYVSSSQQVTDTLRGSVRPGGESASRMSMGMGSMGMGAAGGPPADRVSAAELTASMIDREASGQYSKHVGGAAGQSKVFRVAYTSPNDIGAWDLPRSVVVESGAAGSPASVNVPAQGQASTLSGITRSVQYGGGGVGASYRAQAASSSFQAGFGGNPTPPPAGLAMSYQAGGPVETGRQTPPGDMFWRQSGGAGGMRMPSPRLSSSMQRQ